MPQKRGGVDDSCQRIRGGFLEEVAFTRDEEAGRGWAGAQTTTGAVLAECRGECGRVPKGRWKVPDVGEAGVEICR